MPSGRSQNDLIDSLLNDVRTRRVETEDFDTIRPNNIWNYSQQSVRPWEDGGGDMLRTPYGEMVPAGRSLSTDGGYGQMHPYTDSKPSTRQREPEVYTPPPAYYPVQEPRSQPEVRTVHLPARGAERAAAFDNPNVLGRDTPSTSQATPIPGGGWRLDIRPGTTGYRQGATAERPAGQQAAQADRTPVSYADRKLIDPRNPANVIRAAQAEQQAMRAQSAPLMGAYGPDGRLLTGQQGQMVASAPAVRGQALAAQPAAVAQPTVVGPAPVAAAQRPAVAAAAPAQAFRAPAIQAPPAARAATAQATGQPIPQRAGGLMGLSLNPLVNAATAGVRAVTGAALAPVPIMGARANAQVIPAMQQAMGGGASAPAQTNQYQLARDYGVEDIQPSRSASTGGLDKFTGTKDGRDVMGWTTSKGDLVVNHERRTERDDGGLYRTEIVKNRDDEDRRGNASIAWALWG